jgi:hypothetical protein
VSPIGAVKWCQPRPWSFRANASGLQGSNRSRAGRTLESASPPSRPRVTSRDRAQKLCTFVACHERRTALRRAAADVTPPGRGRVVAPRVHAFSSVRRPSGDICAEVRLSRAMPGIFRPWAFSSLRRFTPSDTSPVLFHTSATYGVQRTGRFERDPRVLVGSSWGHSIRDIRHGRTNDLDHLRGSVVELCCYHLAFDQPFASRHSANASLTAPLADEELRRRAHRHAGSLQIDHVKVRSSPQNSATFPSSEERS